MQSRHIHYGASRAVLGARSRDCSGQHSCAMCYFCSSIAPKQMMPWFSKHLEKFVCIFLLCLALGTTSKLESVPIDHSWRITIYSGFIISACSYHCEFRRHKCRIGLAKDLASRRSKRALLVLTHDRVRARGVADLVFFSVEDPALHRVHASRVFTNGLRDARIRFATHSLMH